MTLSFAALLELARETVVKPQDSARRLMALNLPMAACWRIMALVVVLSVITSQLFFFLLAPGEVMLGVFSSPFLTTLVQGGVLVLTAMAVQGIGRLMGGTGQFADVVLLLSWLQFIMVLLQVVQLAVMLILPPVASLLGLLAAGLFFWLLTNFIAVVHGFRSLGLVFAMVMVSIVVLALLMGVVLTALGIGVAEV